MSFARSAVRGLRRTVLAALLVVCALMLVGGLVTRADPLATVPSGPGPVGRASAPAAVPAAFVDPGNGGGGIGLCPTDSGPSALQKDLLPATRWSSASAQLHSRLNADLWNDTWAKVQRHGTESVYMNVGNTAWAAGSSITEFAARFCLGEEIGRETDQGAAAIGRAILGQDGAGNVTTGPVIPMLIVAVVIGTIIWRKARNRGGSWAPLLKTLAVLAIFFAMLTGATRTTGSSFGSFSPGWLSMKANATIAGLANAPASALDGAVGELSGFAARDSSDRLACSNYVYTLRERYKASYGSAPSASAVPMTLDSMWQQAGLSAYITSQFGQPNEGKRVFCHQLEYNAGVSPAEHMSLAKVQAPGLATTMLAQPWSPADNSGQDRAIMTFAACRLGGGFGINPQFNGVKNPFQNDALPDPADCARTFSTPDADADNDTMWFNWEDGAQDVIQADGMNDVARSFILTYHGNESHAGTGFMYAVVSLAVFVVFLVLGGAIIGAKVGMQVMILLVFLAMLASLIKRDDATGPLAKYLRTYLGMAIFAFGASLLLALVAMISRIIITAGRAFGADGGSILTTIWTGVAPIIAILLVKFIFTDLLRAPNPFKLSSGLAYASLAGGAGFVVGRGLDGLSDRAKHHGRRAGHHVTRKAVSFGSGAGGPVRAERKGGMEPTAGRKAGGGSVGAAGVGVAVGVGAGVAGRGRGAATGGGVPVGAGAPGGGRGRGVLDGARAATDAAEDELHRYENEVADEYGAPDTAAGRRRAEHERAREGARLRREEIGGRVEDGRADRVANRLTMAGKSARDSLANAYHGFRDRPLASTAKVAAVAGAAFMAPVALPAAAAGIGGLWAVNKVRRNRSSAQREVVRQDRLDAYMRAQRKRRAELERRVLLSERAEQTAADDVLLVAGPTAAAGNGSAPLPHFGDTKAGPGGSGI